MVALRLIAHKLLQNTGDSTSRILPILKDSSRYKIEFEQEFSFDPDTLVGIINRVLLKTKITRAYNVEVRDCISHLVVYDFEVDFDTSGFMIPCRGRVQPLGCYNIYFTFFDAEKENVAETQMVSTVDSEENSAKSNYLIVPLVLVIGLSFFIFSKKKKEKKEQESENLIAIGKYKLNKINGDLSINGNSEVLSGKELDLLLLLHKNLNETLERDTILNDVWNDEGAYVGRTLDVFISKLRKKLEADENVKIINVRGVGYKLVFQINE